MFFSHEKSEMSYSSNPPAGGYGDYGGQQTTSYGAQQGSYGEYGQQYAAEQGTGGGAAGYSYGQGYGVSDGAGGDRRTYEQQPQQSAGNYGRYDDAQSEGRGYDRSRRLVAVDLASFLACGSYLGCRGSFV